MKPYRIPGCHTGAVQRFGMAVFVLTSLSCAAPTRADAEDPQAALKAGLSDVESGRFKEAIEPLRAAVKDPTLRDQARFLLGSAYFELHEYHNAAGQLEPLRANPKFAENALYLLEESYRLTKNGPEAERAFADLLKAYTNSALVHKLLGTAHDARGNFREALGEFEKAAAADPSLPQVRFAAGLLCLKLHDEASARKWFEQELAINPCFTPALFYLGEIQRWANDLPAAEAWYRKGLRCDPSNADANLGLGVALQGQNRDADAIPFLRKAAVLNPGKSEVHAQLARSLSKTGQAEAARREMEKARDLARSVAPAP
jgi:tetratricopeptide (TPR) repeat protein